MKKTNIAVIVALLIAPLMFAVTARAATTDFTADANITVSGVLIGSQGSVVDLIIFSGSTSESWTFDSGTFTVLNPGDAFKVGSSDVAVRGVQVKRSDSQVACGNNGTPGTSYVTLPTTAGTYTIIPLSNDCSGGSTAPTGGNTTGGGGGGSSKSKTTTPTTTTPTTTPSTTTPATPVTSTATTDTNLTNVKADASSIAAGTKSEVAVKVGIALDAAKESEYNKSIVGRVVSSVASVSTVAREKILTFVTYGTPTTQVLGAGERGGVVNSFKEAFGRLPDSNTDWEDVVKIANGRWPSQTDAAREEKAEANFEAIYRRAPDRTNAHDDAAVVVMAYGLRSRSRNMASEKAAIKSYRAIFQRSPSTATAWDAVRAIAYSGATR